MRTTELGAQAQPSYAVEYQGGNQQLYGQEKPAFTFIVADEAAWQRILSEDIYAAALGFVRGEFDVRGDLVEAVRFKYAHSRRGFRDAALSLAARFAPRRLETLIQSRSRAAGNIRFHYDRSNEFYSQFLDSRMQYSSAFFQDPSWPLDRAQLAKLDLICRKLDLRPGERFLDVGSGWGGLVLHAVERYGVEGVGCTLSPRQFAYSTEMAKRRGLEGRAAFYEMDYRELEGSFHKIASIGMFEHVGRRRLGGYFGKIRSLLDESGLFLNSGIVRPQFVKDGPETFFFDRKVFPGGELARLSRVICEAESAGLEVLHLQDMRFHYSRTCREWARRLEQNEEACLRLVDAETYRTWRLYLAASALNFEQGEIGDYQVLLGRRSGKRSFRLTPDHVEGSEAGEHP